MKNKLNIFVIFLSIFFCQVSFANVMQYIFPDNYKNPSELNSINQYEFDLSGAAINTYVKFDGFALGGIGTASSSQTDFLPFFYGAIRATKRLALGLNISQPYFTDFQFGDNSIVRFDNIKNITRDIDINPQISYRVLKNLALGVGFIANDAYQQELDFALPHVGNFTNNTRSWSYGWNAGLSYKIDAKDFFNIAYFSKLKPNFKGTSAALGTPNPNFRFVYLYFPATSKAEFTRILTKKWVLNLDAFYTQWSVIKTVLTQNLANGKTLAFPLFLHNNWVFEATTRYQFKPKWALLGLAMVDTGAVKIRGRSVPFPSDNIYVLGLGANYQFSKKGSLQLLLAHAFNNTQLYHPLGLLPTVGSVHVRGNVIELTLSYKA